MIGNDVVDLDFAAKTSNWNRPRFLEKVFTENEQTLISNSKNKHVLIWQLWSMKEAAYKCYIQDLGEPFFNPKKLECQCSCSILPAESLVIGTVSVFGKTYTTKSDTTENYIHTLAFFETPQNIAKRTFPILTENHSQQSELVRTELFRYLRTEGDTQEKISIAKDYNGIPRVFLKGKQIEVSISLSHHGNFGAYAIC